MAANAPAGGQGNPGQTQGQVQPPLNAALQQQLNLEGVKTRAHDLFTAITRILEHFDAAGRHNQTPKWQEVLGQFAMVNVDLLHIVEDIKKVSKAFVVYPKNVNAENSTRLRVSGDQRLPTVLPPHLVPALASGDGALYQKNPLPSNVVTNAGASQQASAAQLIGRSVPSPMAVAGATSIDNASASPLQYANSPRPGTNIMNAPSPQQQQRQKLTQTPQHPQQFQPQQQQLKPQSTPGMAQTQNLAKNQQKEQKQQEIKIPTASAQAVVEGTCFQNACAAALQSATLPQQQQSQLSSLAPRMQNISSLSQTKNFPRMPLNQPMMRGRLPLSVAQNPQEQQSQLHQKFAQDRPSYLNYSNRPLPSGQALQHSIGQNQLNQGSQLKSHLGQLTGNPTTSLYSGTQTSMTTPHMVPGMTPQSNVPRQTVLLSMLLFFLFSTILVLFLGLEKSLPSLSKRNYSRSIIK